MNVVIPGKILKKKNSFKTQVNETIIQNTDKNNHKLTSVKLFYFAFHFQLKISLCKKKNKRFLDNALKQIFFATGR